MSTKNVILTDKNGEQIAPATVSDIVAYDDNTSVKDKIDELNERIDNLVTGNVEPLTITANGVYNAPEGVDGFNPVTVNVGEPDEKVVCNYIFNEQLYDTVRSIIAENPNDSFLLEPQLYNSIYDSVNGVVRLSNQYSMLNPLISFEPFKNYEIEIEYGNIDNQSGSYDRQLIYFTDTILLWYDGHSGRNYLYVENSSSTIVFNDLNLSSLANKTLKLFLDYSKNQVGDIVCTASMQVEGENVKRDLGYIDYYRLNNDLVIGRWSSDEGLYNVDIKRVKVTSKKITIQHELDKHNAVQDTKLEELTREVRQHNDFATRIPVLEKETFK